MPPAVRAMRRFTIAPERIAGGRVTFDRAESRHLARVLRLGPGDLVVAHDGAGHDYTVRVETVGDEVTGAILGVARRGAESPAPITLVQGVPKGDKMEAIVRAATELGAARVVPVLTARTVVRLEPARWRERARRWQRVAGEATKQCGRAVVPVVEEPCPLGAWLARDEPAAARLCLWEGAAADETLGRALDPGGAPDGRAGVTVLVGPEGGLAPDEVQAARARGYTVVGLGPRLLRTETAGPAVVAILQHRLGDLG